MKDIRQQAIAVVTGLSVKMSFCRVDQQGKKLPEQEADAQAILSTMLEDRFAGAAKSMNIVLSPWTRLTCIASDSSISR